jgi:signal transduction histidine kinase
VSGKLEQSVEAQAHEHARSRQRLSNSLFLLGCAVALSLLCAAQSIYSIRGVLKRARWQARELSRLSGHVLEMQEATLRRLSRELHDEFGQTLSAIEANLAAIPITAPEQSARVEDCMLLVQDAIANVRELSQLLRPSILDDFGLRAGLQSLADSFAQRTGIEVRTDIVFDGRLPALTETHLFRITQEALTNIVRHSGAKHADLKLSAVPGAVVLSISDDGHGLTGKNGRTGFGMMGMRERMHAAGGKLHVDSRPGGLTVTAEVPFPDTGNEQQ